MSLEELLVHVCDVEQATISRDASGGIVDSAWTMAYSGVACQAEPLSAHHKAQFMQAGFEVTHLVVTQQDGIKAGWRLNFHDGLYLRVRSVETVRPQGTIPAFYKILCEEVRLS